jgi:hypothetical protein
MERTATVAVIALFDMQFQPEFAPAGLDATSAAARDTRAFDGSTTICVIVDEKDPAHVIVIEQWQTRVARRRLPGLASRRRRADRNHHGAGAAGHDNTLHRLAGPLTTTTTHQPGPRHPRLPREIRQRGPASPKAGNPDLVPTSGSIP